MNNHMAAQQQPLQQNQLPPQPQPFNQQRQTPNVQSAKGPQGPQSTQNSTANFNPQLTLWSLEKAKSNDSWADVKPQQQHISLEELRDELEKFKHKDLTAKRVLDDLKSPNCRKQINTLADNQTKELQKLNKTLKYILGGILPEWRWADRRKKDRILIRVQVILQTVPSGLVEPQVLKPGGGPGNAAGMQQPKQPGNMTGQQQQGNMQNQGPNMGQQPKNVPQPGQHTMAQSQQFDQRLPPPPVDLHGNGNILPPPPFVNGPQVHGGHGIMDGHLPPPPSHVNHGHPRPHHPPKNFMPGAYPVTSAKKQGQPPIPASNTHYMREQKPKPKGRRGERSGESSSDWVSETDSSGTESLNVYSVEEGYGDVRQGHRARSKRESRAKKTTQRRVQSRTRSRSAGNTRQHSVRRRRDSTSSGSRSGRHSPISSTTRSPYNSSSDEGRHGHSKKHKHRSRSSESPTRAYNRKKAEKFGTTSSLSGHSSHGSWSDAASSDHSAGYGRRDRDRDHDRGHRHRRSRSRSRSRSHRRHRKSSFSKHDEPTHRYNIRENGVDDYPYGTASPPRTQNHYRDETLPVGSRPLPHRRHTTQVPVPNPFYAATTPLPQTREQPYNNYGADLQDLNYTYTPQPQGYMPRNTQSGQGRYTTEEVNVLLNHLNKDRQRMPSEATHNRVDPAFMDNGHTQRMPPLRRQYTQRRDLDFLDEAEVNPRYPLRAPAYDGYRR
jgi:hypothetical protein